MAKNGESAGRGGQTPQEGRPRLREPLEDQIPVARNLTPYQKRVEEMENVILCVAEAEKMVKSIGVSIKPIVQLHKRPSPYHFPRDPSAEDMEDRSPP
jgi:hypothetical protein